MYRSISNTVLSPKVLFLSHIIRETNQLDLHTISKAQSGQSADLKMLWFYFSSSAETKELG